MSRLRKSPLKFNVEKKENGEIMENNGKHIKLTDDDRIRLEHVVECELWQDDECRIHAGIDGTDKDHTGFEGLVKRVLTGDKLFGNQVYFYEKFIYPLMHPKCPGPYETGCPHGGTTASNLMGTPEIWLCESCYDSLPEESKF